MKILLATGKTANNHIAKYLTENTKYEITSGSFDRFYDEIMFPSDNYDIVHIHESSIQLYLQAPENFRENMEQFCDRLINIVNTKASQKLIVNTFEYIPFRLFGNMDKINEQGITNVIDRANEVIKNIVGDNEQVALCDVQYLSNWFGFKEIFKLNIIDNASYNGSLPFQYEQAKQLQLIIEAIMHKTNKLLISDLDNTFWGGIVGDIGFENVNSKPAVYKMYRNYILTLKKQGVFTAVSSKNNPSLIDNQAVQEILEKYFIITKINWEPKSKNIGEIVDQFNIFADSAVFVDDNIREIEEVKGRVDTTNILFENSIQLLESLYLYSKFEKVNFTENDAERVKKFVANNKVLEAAGSYQDYLDSLEIDVQINEFDLVNSDVTRIVQLFNKTNQFNNYKEQITEQNIQSLLDSGLKILTIDYSDKFGTEKNISAIIYRELEEQIEIKNWVMSCRVFKRGVEAAILNKLAEGNKEISIRFKKSAKNEYMFEFLNNVNIKVENI